MNRAIDSLRYVLLAVLAVLLLLAGVWIASQGGITSREPQQFYAPIRLIVDSFMTLIAFWFGAAGLGWPLRSWLAPKARFAPIVQLAAGMTVLLLATMGLALAGLLNSWTSWGLCTLGAAIVVFKLTDSSRRDDWHPDLWPSPPWTLLLGLPGLGLFIVACACPPSTLWSVEAHGYDVMSYHLQLPKEWLQLGAMRGLEHNVYSYLPNLMETGYMLVGSMRGTMYQGIYTSQLLHASLAVFAAATIAGLVCQFVNSVGGVFGAVLFLLMPWVIITGSLAYDEMLVMALAGAATMLVFDAAAARRRTAVLIGFLLGGAILAKLPAGPMFAVPIVLIMLTRLNAVPNWREQVSMTRAVQLAAIVCVACAVTLSPYFIRNIAWTGNPVFPFATSIFGSAHWSQDELSRWHNALRPHGSVIERAGKLGNYWLFNTGYGSILGRDITAERDNVAVFDQVGRLPLIWLTVAISVAVLMRWPSGLRVAMAMLLMLAVQLVFWILFSHQQSRFLLPTLLPACVLIGLAFGRAQQLTRQHTRWVLPIGTIAIAGVMTVQSYRVFFDQIVPGTVVEHGRFRLVRLSPYHVIDSLPHLTEIAVLGPNIVLPGNHPVNHIPGNTLTYVVADASRLLYMHNPIRYDSPFDRSRLGELIRLYGGDPLTITEALRREGVTHVWVHLDELARLHRTYGYDNDVTAETIRELTHAGWTVVRDVDNIAVLFGLPGAPQIVIPEPTRTTTTTTTTTTDSAP